MSDNDQISVKPARWIFAWGSAAVSAKKRTADPMPVGNASDVACLLGTEASEPAAVPMLLVSPGLGQR